MVKVNRLKEISKPRDAKKSRIRKQAGSSDAVARWLLPSFLFLVTIIAFLPALQNEFVDWDDYKMLLQNPLYRGLGWAELRWMFTTLHMGHYQPLSWVTFGLDYLVWGMDPFGYHLTNLLLHAANGVVFYFVTLRLLSLAISVSDLRGARGGIALRVASSFAALFFAVHPLRVESVAWATERRDVLSGLFFLLTILFYLRAVTTEAGAFRWWRMSGALIFYGLSLLAKASGVALPFVLLVVDIYPLRRLGDGPGKWLGPSVHRVWLEKFPFLVLAVPFVIVGPIAQHETGALKPFENYGFFARAAQALYGLAFYLWKTVLPLGLSPLYEPPRYIWSLSLSFVLSGAVVIVISLILFFARHRWPAGLACWVCYVVIPLPVLGFFQAGPQLVADRYSYLSCLGFAVLLGAGLAQCWRAWERVGLLGLKLIHGLAAGIILLLATTTWKQTQVWHDSERLWRHALAVAPERLAHTNLAGLLRDQGRTEEAIQHYRIALEFSPSDWKVHNDLATLLDGQGKTEEAVEHYRSALRINPLSVETHYNLGMLLAEQKEFSAAIEEFREVLRLNPDHAKAHYGLGAALANLGRIEEAIDHLQRAVKIKPDFADAHQNLGQLLAARGELKTAIGHFEQAVALEPDFAEAHESLGRALALQGRKVEADGHLQEAVRIFKSRGEAGNVP